MEQIDKRCSVSLWFVRIFHNAPGSVTGPRQSAPTQQATRISFRVAAWAAQTNSGRRRAPCGQRGVWAAIILGGLVAFGGMGQFAPIWAERIFSALYKLEFSSPIMPECASI